MVVRMCGLTQYSPQNLNRYMQPKSMQPRVKKRLKPLFHWPVAFISKVSIEGK